MSSRSSVSAHLNALSFEVQVEELDAFLAFSKIYQEGQPSFFLESADEDASTVSLIGFNPARILKIQDGIFSVTDVLTGKTTFSPDPKSKDSSLSKTSPLDDLKNYLRQYHPSTSVPVPFSGGTVGYLGYECSHYLEQLPKCSEKHFEPEALLFIFQNYLIYDHQLKRLKVIALNFDHLPLETKLKESQSVLDKILQGNASKIQQVKIKNNSYKQILADDLSILGTSLDLEQKKLRFKEKISTIKKHIRDGDIFQCVLSESFQAKTQAKPIDIMHSLRQQSPAPYSYYLDTGDFCLMGASPEMLVRVRGQTVQTCPIAGTRRRGSSSKEDEILAKQLFASIKEKAEHAMLVDLSRNDIGRISKLKSVRVKEFMRLRKFSHVMHLTSLVEGSLRNDLSAWDALFSCFPAGTLSGAPKIRAMEIISQLEQKERGFYGGAIVAADFAGSLDSCIAIRSLLYKRDTVAVVDNKKSKKTATVRFQAGAGVVADSVASKEFQEILDKTQALRRSLLLAEAGVKI